MSFAGHCRSGSWTGKGSGAPQAVYAAQRRTRGSRGKVLLRLRSELSERSFAHVCDTGGAKPNWLRGLASVTKRHLAIVAARNLSTIMRVLCGISSPRRLQGLRSLRQAALMHLQRLMSPLNGMVSSLSAYGT
jgi:hypothetical protein